MTAKDEQDVTRLAFVSDDDETISQHFGRANQYVVLTIVADHITGQELRPKFSPHSDSQSHGTEVHDHDERHARMIEPIKDCQILIAGGMGRGAQNYFISAGIVTLMTDHTSIQQAGEAFIEGSLEHHPGRLHHGHHH